ncbi:MAG: mechanosensitive ion channel family protein [Thermoplasmatota archaeon]
MATGSGLLTVPPAQRTLRASSRNRRPAAYACVFVMLLLVVAIPLPASGGAVGPVLILAPGNPSANLRLGTAESFPFTVRNLDPNSPAFVQVSTTQPRGWEAHASLSAVPLGSAKDPANASVTLDIVVNAVSQDFITGVVQATFTVFSAGASGTETDGITVSPANPFVIALFPNPLPAPLNTAYGVFLIDLALFAIVGEAVILIQEPLVRAFSRAANRASADRAVRRLRVPVMVLATFAGLLYSVEILPASILIGYVEDALRIAVYVLATYLVYKIVDSLLTYWGGRFAKAHTEARIDELLVPILRKVALVVAIIVAIFFVLRATNVDLTVFVAGGVVVSMVLAFAAQDTLSNFFSGIYILVDRPFIEGDVIQLQSGEECRVDYIGLRSTRLYYPRMNEIIVMPNNKLSSDRITNLMHPDARSWVEVAISVAADSDTGKVRGTLAEIARANPKVLSTDGGAKVFLSGIAGDAFDFRLRAPVGDFRDRDAVASDLREAILRAFREKGITMAGPAQADSK